MTGVPWTGAGLLEEISETALDDDYYVFRGTEPRRTVRSGVVVVLVVTALALFITSAAVQTRNDRPATELERRTLASDIQARQKTLDERRATAEGLRAEVSSLQASGESSQNSLADLGVIAASEAATGPGIVITADASIVSGTEESAITDRDLQILVNGLWYAGAEAVAVNGNRIGALTSIRTAGDAITVNFRSISLPYTVIALGDAEALQTRFAQNPAGAYWEKLDRRTDVRFAVTPSSEVTVPAAPTKRLDLNHAKSLEEKK